MAKGKRNRSRRRRRGDPVAPRCAQTTRIVDGIEADCPVCGLRVVLGYTKGSRVVPDGTPTSLHTQPACETFNKLEVDEFAKFVREKLEGVTDA